MPFEKVFVNEYHELDINTKYRFAEIEINQAINTLTQFFKHREDPRLYASSMIYKAITPPSMRDIAELDDEFYRVVSSVQFHRPHKEEQIRYLIMKGHSYAKIRELTKCSFNTISKLRIGFPRYYPVFNRWTEGMLNNWDEVKPVLNIFNEKLIHTK